jgi:sec-independent protein translocase protein TatB
MFNLGFSELLLLGVLALIFIGPQQLPEVARTVARLINEWKRATSDLQEQITTRVVDDVREARDRVNPDASARSLPEASSQLSPEASAHALEEEPAVLPPETPAPPETLASRPSTEQAQPIGHQADDGPIHGESRKS